MFLFLFYFLSINLALAQEVGPVGPSAPPPVSDSTDSDVPTPPVLAPKPNIDLPYKPANNNSVDNATDFTPMPIKKAEPVKEIVIPYITSKSPQSFGAADPQ